jgi:hypothetical protein
LRKGLLLDVYLVVEPRKLGIALTDGLSHVAEKSLYLNVFVPGGKLVYGFSVVSLRVPFI